MFFMYYNVTENVTAKEVYMDINAMSQLITTLGFPIAMCIFLMIFVVWYINKRDSQLEQTLKQNTEATNKLVTLITTLVDMEDLGKGEKR